MLETTLNLARRAREYIELPASLKTARRADHRNGLRNDPGIEWTIREGLAWLARAQDSSTTADGGVSRHYNLLTGWGASYPETTGYIVPTFLEQATLRNDAVLRDRARRMLDWVVSIQLPSGGFQGGMVNQTPVVPVTFNTGQILLGLAAGVREFGDRYRRAMCAAADWLVATQDDDGCWRRHPSPFAVSGEKAYDTHVAWGLIEAERQAAGRGYAAAAVRNARWAISHQRANGWFERCCLGEATESPHTHTIGYALRGLVEVYRFHRQAELLDRARRTANGVVSALRRHKTLPGRLDANWRGTVRWTCLTGNAQIAHALLLLYQETGTIDYCEAAAALNLSVRRSLSADDPLETRGAIKGSFPIDGQYCAFEYPNWATKFAIDANSLELRLLSKQQNP